MYFHSSSADIFFMQLHVISVHLQSMPKSIDYTVQNAVMLSITYANLTRRGKVFNLSLFLFPFAPSYSLSLSTSISSACAKLWVQSQWILD